MNYRKYYRIQKILTSETSNFVGALGHVEIDYVQLRQCRHTVLSASLKIAKNIKQRIQTKKFQRYLATTVINALIIHNYYIYNYIYNSIYNHIYNFI